LVVGKQCAEPLRIEYYLFDKLKEIDIEYKHLTIEKKTVWYKPVYYVAFKANGKTILKQYQFGSFNGRFMDNLVNLYYARRSEISSI